MFVLMDNNVAYIEPGRKDSFVLVLKIHLVTQIGLFCLTGSWRKFIAIKEDTHKKKFFFLVVGPLRFYPPYTNGLVVHATFFFVVL